MCIPVDHRLCVYTGGYVVGNGNAFEGRMLYFPGRERSRQGMHLCIDHACTHGMMGMVMGMWSKGENDGSSCTICEGDGAEWSLVMGMSTLDDVRMPSDGRTSSGALADGVVGAPNGSERVPIANPG